MGEEPKRQLQQSEWQLQHSEVQQLQVPLGERSYPIWIGQKLLQRLDQYLQQLHIGVQQKLLIVTDDHVHARYGESLAEHLRSSGYTVFVYAIPAGEASKSMAVYEQVMTYAIEAKLDRKSVILALGGGVVGDLAGFVASTFMRGIDFVQLPTTVLAHDSSVGGKVAINHRLGKNLVGSFFQPRAVVYDTATLHTLPKREVQSGLAELLKHALIWDEHFVHWFEEYRSQCQSLQEPYISQALSRACQIKAEVVSQDEQEQGLRAILNFGHTFGHAFEALGEYDQLTHGEAISIGMVLAAKVSEHIYGRNGISARVSHLLQSYGLPVHWKGLPWSIDQILAKMYADKKTLGDALNLILMPEIGRVELVRHVDPDLIRQVWLESVE